MASFDKRTKACLPHADFKPITSYFSKGNHGRRCPAQSRSLRPQVMPLRPPPMRNVCQALHPRLEQWLPNHPLR